MRTSANILISIAILFEFLFGCKTSPNNQKQVFYYNEPTGIASLDPAYAKNQSIIWAVHQIYNTLVETDADLKVKPSLAKKWEVSQDHTEYIFHLRTDVFFHDHELFPGGKGRRMVASDIVYSFERLINSSVASPGAWIFNGRVDSIRPFYAANDSTFILRLQRPFSPILGVLSNVYCSVVAQEIVEKFGKEFRSHPCGTGPFKLKSWEEGQALILWKNPNYWEKDQNGKTMPYLDAIKISFFDSKATEFLLFQQGKLSFINDIEASFKDEILNKKGELKSEWEGKILLKKHPYLNTEYLGILVDSNNELVKQSPLQLKKVRQAINFAFDRRKMMLYLRNSIGKPAESGFVPQGLPSFDESLVKGYNFDPNKSRQLLIEAGYGSGKKLPVIKLLTIPVYAELGSFIAKQLEDAGIPVQVEAIPKSLLLEQTAKSQAVFFRGSWIADYPDAENYLSVFYGKNPAPPNYTRYKNSAFDQLYEKAMLVDNDSLRYILYRQMDSIIIDDAPIVPLWYDEAIHLVQPDIIGFYPNALNLLELRKTSIGPKIRH